MGFSNAVLIGNALSMIAMVFVFMSSGAKTKNWAIGYQTINAGIQVVAFVILQGYGGAVQLFTATVRNIFTLKKWQNKYSAVFFVIACIVLGLALNNNGYIGLLPLIASVQNAIIMVSKKATLITVRCATAVSTFLWAIYSFVLLNYVNALANVVVCVSSVIHLIRDVQNKNKTPAT